jgi:hypothetical protein
MDTGDEHTTVSRVAPGESAPPASNQGNAEPFPSAPEESPQSSGGDAGSGTDAEGEGAASAGSSSRAPGEQGEAPRPIEPDAGEGVRQMQPPVPAPGVAGSGVPAPGGQPGDSGGVPVPSVHAAAGTSEEQGAVGAVRTAVTAPGKPDGEVDTRA